MLDALRWWLALEAVALVTLPLCLALFRSLPDRGFAFNKAVALIAVCYTFWLLCSLQILPNDLTGVLIALAIVAGVSALMLWRTWRDVRAWASGAISYIVAVEAVAAVVFTLVTWFRSFNGQISRGEKPMEFAHLNAVYYADHFPPKDVWLSGHDVAYYYFGYVMVAVVGRLSFLPTEIAFNLGFAMFVAAAAAAAFGLAYNLIAATTGNSFSSAIFPRALPWAGGATLGFLLMGNLVGVFVFASAYGIGGVGFYEWLDVGYLSANEGRRLWYPGDAYGFSSSAAPIPISEIWSAATEAPIISIYIGDLHPHLMNLPFLLIAAGTALSIVLSTKAGESMPVLFTRAAGFGILVGATGFVSSWDLPPLLVLGAGAYAVSGLAQRDPLRSGAALAVFVIVAILAYLPFYAGLDGQSRELAPVARAEFTAYPGTQFVAFLLHWGPLCAFVVPAILAMLVRRWADVRPWHALLAAAIPLAIVITWALLLSSRIDDPAYSAVPTLEDQIRLRGWAWLSAISMAGIFVAASLAFDSRIRADASQRDRIEAVVTLLVAIAALLIFIPDFLFIRDDVLRTRFVTLFKLTYVAWTLLAVAAGYAAYDIVQRAVEWGRGGRALLIGCASVAACGLLTPIGAIPNRIAPGPTPNVASGWSDANRTFDEPDTLDGLRSFPPDERAAVEWLRERAAGQRYVLVESVADGLHRGDYTRAARFSGASGVPAVLGWPDHESQWRGSVEEVAGREADVKELYMSTDLNQVEPIIRRYGIDFLAVGHVERETYPAAALRKFDAYPVAFAEGEVVIYDVQGVDN